MAKFNHKLKLFSKLIVLFLISYPQVKANSSLEISRLNYDYCKNYVIHKISPDSLELISLIRKIYFWHARDTIRDFPTVSQDTLYTGIDWIQHRNKMEEMKKTNFFSKQFLNYYNNIAIKIDSYIKKSKESNNGLPPNFYTDGDDWCGGCQVIPQDYIFKEISLTNLNIYADSASFSSKSGDIYPLVVKVKAIKEGKIWKIASLEGFIIHNDLIDLILKDLGR